MSLRDVLNAGSDILDAVTSAEATGDYSNLSQAIRKSVSTMTDGKHTSPQGQSRPKHNPYVYNEHLKGTSAEWKRPDSLRTYSQGTGGKQTAAPRRTTDKQLPATPYFNQGIQRFSPYAGGLQMALGAIGSLGSAGIALALFIPGVALSGGVGAGLLAGAGVLACGSAIGGWVAKKGYDKTKLFHRYRQYGRVIGDADYIALADLSHLSGTDEKQILKDVETCQKAGYLPNTFVDNQKTTLMVTRNAYDQYVKAESARVAREKEQLSLKDSLSGTRYGAQVQQILNDGETYLKTVRELNRRIPDGDMTRKISRIEDLMGRTFEEVKKQPKAAPSLRKYMSYYLPTTVKLLNAYADLDGKPEIGENITQTKQEISDSLDMVGDGFEKLFDSLFEEMSMDISSDISVMKTMMAQDGLTEDSVVFRKQEGGEHV